MAAVKEVRVPDIGNFVNVDVIEVFVKPGDRVHADQSLITLESDKATVEIPAPADGVVRELLVKVGDKVSTGSPVLTLEVEADAARTVTASPPPPAAPQPAPPATPPPAAASAPGPMPTALSSFAQVHASPSVRHFARELGVDLSKVRGTGPKERILKEDVQAYVKGALARPAAAGGGALPPPPEVDFSRFGPVETQALSRVKKLSGPHLHRSWVGIPHVTQHDLADITELEAFRKAMAEEARAQGVRLTLLAFVMKASVAALQQFPEFNASLAADGQSLILKRYYHLGCAVDTPEGLVVPVIRNVDQKSVLQLAGELAALSAKARDRKLAPDDIQGGCFSISSLGGIGGTAFTPIINAPEVAILGISKSAMQPVFRDGAFVPRLMLPLSLSYDHRVIDGAAAARFTTLLGSLLGDLRRLVL